MMSSDSFPMMLTRIRQLPGGLWHSFCQQLRDKPRWKQALIILIWSGGAFLVSSILSTLAFAVLPVPITPLMVIRSVE